MKTKRTYATTGLLALVMLASTARAQVSQYEWQPTDRSNWNMASNWLFTSINAVPDAAAFPGETASINNGGTAIVDSNVPVVAELLVTNGTLQIEAGGVLETIDDGVGNGNATIGGGDTIALAADGSLTVANNLTNAGTLQITGPVATVQVNGDYSQSGTLNASISDPNAHSAINVTGTASLAGTLAFSFDGFEPSFGQSWPLVNAGAVSGGFASVDSSAAPALSRGLNYAVIQSGGNVSLAVDNALILSIQRQAGTMVIENAAGGDIEISGYAVRSANGDLSAENWTSLASSNAGGPGWTEANPTTTALSELNLTDTVTLQAGQSLEIGATYNGAAEDVVFQYTTPDGRLEQGFVEYAGPLNDLVLFVDPETGEGAMGNFSRFIDTPVITGYAVFSDAGSLDTSGWSSFASSGEAGDGWVEANPAADHIAELNLTEMTSFNEGTIIDLGNIFSVGSEQDLAFQYTTAAGELLTGSVQYGAIPGPAPGQDGDYDGDGFVGQGDIDLVLLNWGDDVSGGAPNGWTSNFPTGNVDQDELDAVLLNWGQGSQGLTPAGVPEPSALVLAGLALVCSLVMRRRP